MIDDLVTILNDAKNSTKDIIDKIDKSSKQPKKVNLEEWLSDAVYDEDSDDVETDDDDYL